MIGLWAAIAAVMAWSIARQQHRPKDYGFTLRGGGAISLAVLVAVHAYLVVSGKFDPAVTANLWLAALGAFLEEVAFRAIAIDKLILLLEGVKAKVFWAILASSAVWTLLHVPSKSPAQLPGLFLSALILGYAYYVSRSILLPAWIHGLANAGYVGAALIAVLYFLIAAADFAIGYRKQKKTLRIADA